MSLTRWLVGLASVAALGLGCSLGEGKQAGGDAAGLPQAPLAPFDAAAPDDPAPSPAGDAAGVEPAAGEAPAPSAPAVAAEAPPQAPQSFVPPTPDSLALLLKVRGLDRKVPRGIYLGVRPPSDEIHRNIVSAIDACRRYIADYPGTEPWCEVRGVLARMELARVPLLMQAVQAGISTREEAQSKYDAHLAEVIKLAEAAAAECPPSAVGHADALHALVYLYERADDFEKLRSTAGRLLEKHPGVDGRPLVHLAVARSYLYTQRYAEGEKYIEEVIRSHGDDPEYVLYMEMLHDALTAGGDLEGLEELAELRIAEYPTRIPKLPEGHYLASHYEEQLCIAPFWIGFVRMALGENDRAREAFKAHIRAAQARDEELASHGHPAKKDSCYITVEHRSKRLLEFVDKFAGKVPAVDLELGDLWATPRQPTLRESRGKVVAIVFRMPGNTRTESFLQHIDGLAKKHRDDLTAVTLGYRAGRPNPTEDRVVLQKLRDDLERLRVDMPAGFDPDREGQKIFIAMNAYVGAASFVALNRRGELAWFLADPREIDRAIATRVIERLLAEPRK